MRQPNKTCLVQSLRTSLNLPLMDIEAPYGWREAWAGSATSQRDSPASAVGVTIKHSEHLYFEGCLLRISCLPLQLLALEPGRLENFGTTCFHKAGPFTFLLCPHLGELVGLRTRIIHMLQQTGYSLCQSLALGLLFFYTFSSERGWWTWDQPFMSTQMYSGKCQQSQYTWLLPSGLK